MANFEYAFNKILFYEGNYSNEPFDKGGETKYGITKNTAKNYGYFGDIKNLTIEDAKNIYKSLYWNILNLDLVNDDKIATEIFDISVNCGTYKAGLLTQKALNIINKNQSLWKDIKEDGIIGTQTITILNNLSNNDKNAFIKTLNGLQFMYYYDITKNNPINEYFFRGWIKRT